LRRALELSRESFIVSRMENIRALLGADRYGEAAPLQKKVLEDLDRLAASLSAEQWAGELARLHEAERRLSALIQRQSAATARTGELAAGSKGVAAPSEPDLAAAADQQALRAEAEGLYAELRGGPGAADLGAALKSMSSAEQSLAAAAHAEAMKAQEAASLSLHAALDAVRQAIERLQARQRAEARLKLIEALKRMLEAQQAIHAETARADGLLAGEAVPRAVRLAVADLAARQEALGATADEALSLVRDDPTAIALPVALRQVKADIAASAALLRNGVTGAAVQSLQQEIEEALKAMIEALQGAEAARAAPPPQPKAQKGAPSRGMLVDVVAELKVLRAMEVGLKGRTERFDQTRGRAGELPPGARDELARLSARQGEVTAALTALQNELKKAEAE
jgi:hypothetical protein